MDCGGGLPLPLPLPRPEELELRSIPVPLSGAAGAAGGLTDLVLRRCPHEIREVREGIWIAAIDYHFRCGCPDRAAWDCDQYSCLCPERRAVPND